MKLRNKRTGEIGYTAVLQSKAIVVMDENAIQLGSYTSLAELNEEWEDYEEPETFWYMTAWGDVKEYSQDQFAIKQKIAIGNYFETKEEAELAVRKLKAWKRLKDEGFRFNKWTIPEEPKTPHIKLVIEAEMDVPDSPYDLDLLFGGE